MPGVETFGKIGAKYVPQRRPDGTTWLQKQVQERRDPDSRDFKSLDIARLLPRTSQLLSGLIKDPDSVLDADPEGYAVVYGDDQIATSLDNAFLPIAAADWRFVADDPQSEKLVGPLTRLALKRVPGWSAMIMHLCQARVMGASLIRVVWKFQKRRGRYEGRPIEFTPYDKRQFAIDRPEWDANSMFLIDDGSNPRLGQIFGFAKAVDRENYIVSQWRNTQDRFGYGQGIGDRLYRMAKWRKPIIRLLLQTLEAHAGGVRVATVNSDVGMDESKQTRIMNSVQQQFANAISLDTVTMPFGVDLKVIFPPGDLLRSIKDMVDGFLNPQISKLINGVTLTEQPGEVGSYALGQVHAAQQHLRIQSHANTIAEELNRDYIPQILENNPHLYDEAGVPRDTEPPTLVAMVPGGHDRMKAAQLVATLNQAGVDLVESDVYEQTGFERPTDEHRASGQIISGQAAPTGGSGLDLFGSALRQRIPWHSKRSRPASKRQSRFDEGKIDRDPTGQFDGDGIDGEGDVEAQQEAIVELDQRRLDEFDSEGFTVNEAQAWSESGVSDATHAAQWTELGYGPADVAQVARAEPIDLIETDAARVNAARPSIDEAVNDPQVREQLGDLDIQTGDGGSLLVRGAQSAAMGAAIALALIGLFAATDTLTGPTVAAAMLAGVAPLVSGLE